MIKRWLLARRPFDSPFLTLGVVMLVLGNPLAKWVFSLFGLIGVNLGFARHRTWRYADPAFSWAIVCYVAWSVVLVVARNEPILDNRFLTYCGIMLGFVFLPMSISLVRQPLDTLILGSRLAILAVLVLIPFDPLLNDNRLGLGLNEAILAFLVAVAGLAARMEAQRPEAYLPNSRLWTYVSLVPVLMTGTRAAWFVYLLVAVFDLMALLPRWREVPSRMRWLALPAAAAVLAVAVPATSLIETRWDAGLEEIQQLEETGVATGSVDVRAVMWAGTLAVVADHPLTGVGSTNRVAAVADAVGADNAIYVGSFTHLHNLFLDEAASNGLVGLVLLIGIFGVFLVQVTRAAPGGRVVETSYAFVFLVVTFGSFHGVLLNEWMVLSTFSFMTLVLVSIRREAFRVRYSTRPAVRVARRQA
ncbi:O-antigen ligase [Aurantimonas sp. HBX-1]|uniref:O-antigen ligase family protein n=1 Tax=Aurantimonas sp. HBX-1 TaxID=2906072 RepID=UPI001F34818E|nr:O-antigen ligase family protein [Aurantimonas sp. HBX-1]UIJ70231.1 O-antigen ligase family protein [Aurantimonas sp. HBX-1]